MAINFKFPQRKSETLDTLESEYHEALAALRLAQHKFDNADLDHVVPATLELEAAEIRANVAYKRLKGRQSA